MMMYTQHHIVAPTVAQVANRRDQCQLPQWGLPPFGGNLMANTGVSRNEDVVMGRSQKRRRYSVGMGGLAVVKRRMPTSLLAFEDQALTRRSS